MPNFKHGFSAKKDTTYMTWQAIRQRCQNPKSKDYSRYGGKGVYVDERWDDYSVFLSDMGEKPQGYTIERIDSLGPYSKENCRWATTMEQNNNKSDTIKVVYRGTTMTISELSRVTNIPHLVLWQRISKHNWSVEDAINVPIWRKTDEEKVSEIKRLVKDGIMYKDIAVMCGVSASTVSRIGRNLS